MNSNFFIFFFFFNLCVDCLHWDACREQTFLKIMLPCIRFWAYAVYSLTSFAGALRALSLSNDLKQLNFQHIFSVLIIRHARFPFRKIDHLFIFGLLHVETSNYCGVTCYTRNALVALFFCFLFFVFLCRKKRGTQLRWEHSGGVNWDRKRTNAIN